MDHNAPAVTSEQHNHVLLVTINRPAAGNSVNADVHHEMGLAIDRALADDEVRAIVLTGAGQRFFSTGADLKALARGESLTPSDPREASWGFAGFVRRVIGKPTIAAVNGLALGGGMEIVLACDLAVSSDAAAFGLPEVTRGLLAGGGGSIRILEQVPYKVGMEILLTGKRIDASRAFELGLVNAVTSQDGVVERAMSLATDIARNAPLAVMASKRVALGVGPGGRLDEITRWERLDEERAINNRTFDALEGPRAFAENRAPVWRGR